MNAPTEQIIDIAKDVYHAHVLSRNGNDRDASEAAVIVLNAKVQALNMARDSRTDPESIRRLIKMAFIRIAESHAKP